MGRLLRDLELPHGVLVELRRVAGLDLLEVLGRGESLVVVDASRTDRAPGSVTVMRLDDLEAFAEEPCCCHGLGLAEVVALARRLDALEVPSAVHVVTIEGRNMSSYGTALSPEVEEAIPRALDAVLELVGAPTSLREAARVLAESRRGFAPSAEELASED